MHLGRFVTRDVNAAALPIITALAFNAEALEAIAGSFDPRSHYGSGLHLYLFAGGNPITNGDPLGLEWSMPGIMVTLGINTALGAAGGGIATLVDPYGVSLRSFLFGMLTGGLTGAAATFGVGWGALSGAIVNGGVAWIEGASGPGIMMSSLFGLLGGAAGGVDAGDMWDLALQMFVAQADVSLYNNFVY